MAERGVLTILTKGSAEERNVMLETLSKLDGVEQAHLLDDYVKMVVRRGGRAYTIVVKPATEGAVDRLIASFASDWARDRGESERESEKLASRILSLLKRPSSDRLPGYVIVGIYPSPRLPCSQPVLLSLPASKGRAAVLYRIYGQKSRLRAVETAACIICDMNVTPSALRTILDKCLGRTASHYSFLYNMKAAGGT